ncbi:MULTISPECIES: histidine kinase dimerization/phosphoacceptor domain-containing protein [Corynebacterium]|uniref:histidine kinase dimerization/phosphoacceptor domain-containing protein n=1 Tax=Corynebacterium TaxID=1716 RepID=UPI001CD45585|nr:MULTISPECIES: histidine kinase [Corynebacterium]
MQNMPTGLRPLTTIAPTSAQSATTQTPAPLDWRSRMRFFVGSFPAADLTIAATFLLCCWLSMTSLLTYGPSFTYVTNVILSSMIAGAAAFRHKAVRASFVITYSALAGLALLVWLSPVNLGVDPIIVAAPLSLWAVTRWEQNRTWGIVGLFLGLIGSFLNPAVPAFGFTPERLLVFGLPAVLITASAYAVPLWLRINAEEHAAELENVVALNKLELSRELHDVVGHGLTSIKVQAQTALYLAEMDDSRAESTAERAALEGIAQTAARSLRDVHALVDALREGGEISADPNEKLSTLVGYKCVRTAFWPSDWFKTEAAGSIQSFAPITEPLEAQRVACNKIGFID